MSWKASAYVKSLIDCPSGDRITRNEKLVALVLADSHQDKAHAHTFPSVENIAEDSLMSKRECQRVLASLEQKGVISRVRPEVQYRGVNTFYKFPHIDKEGCQPVTLPKNKDVQKDGEKGGQKGDRRVTHSAPYIEEQEQEQEQKQKTSLRRADSGPTVFDLPLIDGTEYGVTQELFFAYRDAFPAISIMGELAKMRAWLLTNPKNRKTRSGVGRFMTSWLSRAQDRAPAQGGHSVGTSKAQQRTTGMVNTVREGIASVLGVDHGSVGNHSGDGGTGSKPGATTIDGGNHQRQRGRTRADGESLFESSD